MGLGSGDSDLKGTMLQPLAKLQRDKLLLEKGRFRYQARPRSN